MSLIRSGSPGATRVCPHCKATVLESAAVCPGCRHHLRFGGAGQTLEPGEGYCALSVDGTIAHTQASEPCEYCVVLDVRDERGTQLTRQVVGVGVLQSGERRRLNVSVEMLPVRAHVAVKAQAPLKPPGATVSSPSMSAKPAASSNPNGPQQPANMISSNAASASMRGLGVIRKPR
ncbi:MAG TPA: hypothetical protein VGP20_09315 [Steroidobacteraceae bacterium]|jgi:hypothetical protein|nr:hypothetical protein [Steroidobacteraceae bacterium]